MKKMIDEMELNEIRYSMMSTATKSNIEFVGITKKCFKIKNERTPSFGLRFFRYHSDFNKVIEICIASTMGRTATTARLGFSVITMATFFQNYVRWNCLEECTREEFDKKALEVFKLINE